MKFFSRILHLVNSINRDRLDKKRKSRGLKYYYKNRERVLAQQKAKRAQDAALIAQAKANLAKAKANSQAVPQAKANLAKAKANSQAVPQAKANLAKAKANSQAVPPPPPSPKTRDRRESNRVYYQANRDRLLAAQRKKRREGVESFPGYRVWAASRRKNTELSEKRRAYYFANRDRILAQSRERLARKKKEDK